MLRHITDIETTGIDPVSDRLVELACGDLGPYGSVVAERQTLVRPDRPIPAASTAVHHRERRCNHTGLSDALVATAIFVELPKRASWEELLRSSSEPARYARLTFGRHRGEKYSDVAGDYLEWIVNRSALDAEMKASAAYWQGARGGAGS